MDDTPDDMRRDLADDLHRFETPDEAFQYIRYAGSLPDAEIDMGETALALALLFMPGLNPDRYRHHLKKVAGQLREEFQTRLRNKAPDNLATRVAALRKVLHEVQGYKGDAESYDDLQNANIIRVIERRRGLPIALGILYVVMAEKMGWRIDGLNFPGHFLIRMEKDGERVILDPFREGKEMDAAELRKLLKSIVGDRAELSHDFYAAVPRRDMLVRLQNNLKKRLIDNEDYAQAVVVLESMEALAPGEYRSMFDKGVLYAKLGQRSQAAEALRRYIEHVPDARARQQAQAILQQILANPE
ncbi:MAG: tetratricopeptide repeat protein [Alphaproteobacteria bacterium]|nr:tetratricopeptide repeat protein [Alphaproteobacteria bacterium]